MGHAISFISRKMAEIVLNEYNFDQAFIGAAGLDPQKGTTTFNELAQLS
ncbi:MAG: DeoR/GlpR family transcriptional regulator of sugar metabolism [Paraglaciecola sp.]|jgi:DeoR/GlpR family transcriptional regulator of sugar metabolism